MNAQPDYNLIVSSFATAGAELSKLPNVPALNNQILLSIQNNQATIQQSLATMQQSLATMQQSLVTMQNNQATMQQSLVTMQQSLNAATNSSARNQNRFADLADLLAPVLDANGAVPAAFPLSSEDISRLNAQNVNAILASYNLAINGTVPDRRNRLLRYLGCH